MDVYNKRDPVIPRQKPMKLLVLGFPRTGTTSVCAALKVLGLKSYHWNEVFKNQKNGHVQLWLDAMNAKYHGKGKPFVGEDFDTMLWDYDVNGSNTPILYQAGCTANEHIVQAVSDGPCCIFADELLAAYPDAKVILTIRTRESWLRSMQNSILEVLSWRSWTILSYLDPEFSAGFWALWNCNTAILSRGITPACRPEAYPALLETFDKHYDHLRKVVPKHKLLEFHPSQGWEPLCQFLNIPLPEEDFPNLNQPISLVEIHRELYWSRWYHVAQGMVKKVGMVGLVVLAAIWMMMI
ncbi:uncharacterized protein GIQ15_06720 [Arthroderma uncinatum]|uniref:uncharacterized protein n=1 Tax=Arthroderma uncinatum TaxID=74035 RepID=UPI00144AAB31|nr:uncharacterized protein GIQ15_06720 [Arthroderma uncinatum]KAF3479744.1 hypothetical protein GIQ15_06720 [Arthroderma uncinatum]